MPTEARVQRRQHASPSLTWDRSRGVAGLPTQGLEGPAANRPGPRCLWTAGFIANRAELRRRIGVSDAVPDPGLLLALVERRGAESAAAEIAGPFSWSVWEPEKRRIVAIRDRQGAHPVYWREEGAVVRLGAEPGLAGESASPGLDLHAVAGHLAGAGPPPGCSFFRGTGCLEPGELIAVSDRSIIRRRYWRVEPSRPLRLRSDEAYAARLRELLDEVVAGYVPSAACGITLSGGMDSTSIAATITTATPVRPVAILWSAPELPEADESRLSRRVACFLGLRSVEVRADLNWPLSGGLPAGTCDGPELTPYPDLWTATFETSRRSGVNALFTGASGDNLFGGVVSSYPDLLLTLRWGPLLRQLRQHLPHSRLGLGGVLRRMVLGPIRHAWLGGGRPRPPRWLTASVRQAALEGFERAPRPPLLTLPGRRQHLFQLLERLPGLAAAQLGRRAAEHGLELRQPLLDHRLVELAASLPPEQVFRAGRWKHVLRNAMRGRMPDDVLSLRGKVVPFAIFRRGLWERERARVLELFGDLRAAELGYLEPAKLHEDFVRFFEGRSGDSRFWQALTLESWLRARP